MFKKLLPILINRLKSQAIDSILEAIVQALAEYRRANRDGEFDLHKRNGPPDISSSEQQWGNPTTPKESESFFKKIFKF